MGGLVGILALCPGGVLHGRARTLFLNDVAPEVSLKAIDRIKSYTSSKRTFSSVSEARSFFREVYAQFGTLSDQEWTSLTVHSLMRSSDGRWTQHYDQAVFDAFASGVPDPAWVRMWSSYDSLDIPVLVFHGVDSDLLTTEITDKLKARGENGPKLEIVDVQGCGHTPMLNCPEQWAHIDRFIGV